MSGILLFGPNSRFCSLLIAPLSSADKEFTIYYWAHKSTFSLLLVMLPSAASSLDTTRPFYFITRTKSLLIWRDTDNRILWHYSDLMKPLSPRRHNHSHEVGAERKHVHSAQKQLRYSSNGDRLRLKYLRLPHSAAHTVSMVNWTETGWGRARLSHAGDTGVEYSSGSMRKYWFVSIF